MNSPTEAQKLVAWIETALNKASIPVSRFCVEAKINRATWQRWKAGTSSPHAAMSDVAIQTVDRLTRKAA